MKEDVEEHSIREGDLLLAKDDTVHPYKWLAVKSLPNGGFKYLWSDGDESCIFTSDGHNFAIVTWELVR